MTETPNNSTPQQPPAQPFAQQQGQPPQGVPQGTPQPQYYAAQPAPYKGLGSVQKEKWPAVVLAFVLGALGIHKFYLGYKNEGLIMLLVSVIGAVCTIGLGTIVMAIISLVEAVKYVTLTEADFQATYVYGRKGWF